MRVLETQNRLLKVERWIEWDFRQDAILRRQTGRLPRISDKRAGFPASLQSENVAANRTVL